MTQIAAPREILDYWVEIGPEKWWTRNEDVDAEIDRRFGQTWKAACRGELDAWLGDPDSALALIIVLDQFSRNLNRNSPKAYAEDERCAQLVRGLMASGLDRRMRSDIGMFCYLPLMHAENPHDQATCLEEMKRLDLEDNIRAAREHADIIDRFGRFPHRNDVLGRQSTAEERAFLDDGGFGG